MKTSLASGLAFPMLLWCANAGAGQVLGVSPVRALTSAADETASSRAAPISQSPGRAADSKTAALSRAGVAVKLGMLGVGFEVATPVHQRANVRLGFNVFSHIDDFNFHGIDYAGPLKVRSLDAHFDWFVFGGRLHLSPGVLLFNGAGAELNAAVPGGRGFSLGDTSYVSDRANPVAGSLRVGFDKVSPTLLVGWGNPLRPGGGHFSIPFEAGVAFQGAATASLSLAGGACDPGGVDCRDVSSDSGIQRDVSAEQDKIRRHESSHWYLRFYPVVSVGVGYRF